MKDQATRTTVTALLIAAWMVGLAVDKYGHRNYGGAAQTAAFAVFILSVVFCTFMSKLLDAIRVYHREMSKVLEKDSQDPS